MHVYVGIGDDPLWMMGPAFIGQQHNNAQTPSTQPGASTWTKDAYQAAASGRDMASSWETLPVPPRRSPLAHMHPPRPRVRPRPMPPPQVAGAAPGGNPQGILQALLRWLSS